MHGQPSPFLGLLVWLIAASAFAQFPEASPPPLESFPIAGEAFQTLEPSISAGLPPVADRPAISDLAPVAPTLSPSERAEGPAIPLDIGPEVPLSDPAPTVPFLGYRYEANSTEWILGSDDELGMFSFGSNHYQPPGATSGLGFGLEFHFLNGPVQTDMPPRLYDFSVAWQSREKLGPLAYDVAASVMASSDFEGSSREGIRFPAHAVGFLTLRPRLEVVFGVDYLDRGDVKLLPVGGLIAVPCDGIRLEAVFPRPRVVFQVAERRQLYVSGELGGGSWAVERATIADDLATYRDLRLAVGLQSADDDRGYSAIEIGYLFARRLEYTSGNGDYDPADTAMIRLLSSF